MDTELIDLWQRRATRKAWESNIIKRLMEMFEVITLLAVKENNELMAKRLWEFVDVFMEWSEMLHAEKQDEAELARYVATITASLDTYHNIIKHMTSLERNTFDYITNNALKRMNKETS